MLCLGCHAIGHELLCGTCRRQLVTAGPRLIADCIVARPAFRHEGLARALIHDFKYRGVVRVAALLAPSLAEFLPAGGRLLVPVPRVVARHLRLGIDPGFELARAVGRLTGMPIARVLRPPVWRANHAGKQRRRRAAVAFRPTAQPPPGVILVDDVLTTGATLESAVRALGPGVVGAVTATGAGV
ncbi:MAG: ComF family protein [Acidimicrobiia bacterium]|nr:ComF family protein [Acidimicrobiia bacterium]